jgi:RHS repeat-associated protein
VPQPPATLHAMLLRRLISLVAALVLACASTQTHAYARALQPESALPARAMVAPSPRQEIAAVTPSRTKEICPPLRECASTLGVTGYQKDNTTGLYYAQARWYDPLVGNFNGMDPAFGDTGTPLSLNKYLYGNANPTYYVDPDGREACVGHELVNCPMASYTPNHQSVPQVVASDALKGNPQFSEVAADRVEALPSVATGPSTHVQSERYRYVPYVNPDGTPGVRYYQAQNLSTDRFDYTVSPGQLDQFIGRERDYADASAIGHAFGDTAERDVHTIRMLRDMSEGNVASALSQVPKAWASALTDPLYYVQVASVGATGFMRGGPKPTKVARENTSGIEPGTGPSMADTIRANVEASRAGNAASNFETHAAREFAQNAIRPIGELRAARLKDAHHVVQDAAVRDLPGYDTNAAPGVQLAGPSSKAGTPHYGATQSQRQPGGGDYGSERLVAFRALRAAGFSERQAQAMVERVDDWFTGINVTPSTTTRIPGNRKQ